jgi:DNA-binding response OmpR family regulator
MDRRFDILLVEDDPSLGSLIKESLTTAGHRVTLVWSVDDAFDSFVSEPRFDAILLDLQVGDERGESLIEKLHIHRLEIPPIIVMSAQPEYQISSSARWINASSVLAKPCTLSEIEETLRRVVR